MRRHPIFLLDSRELYRPVAVEAVEEIAAIGGNPVRLDALPAAGGRMNFPPHPERWAPALQAKHGGVGYLERMTGGGLVWLRYWLFWLHNPKAYVGMGNHEGDWECVQVGYAGDTPVCVTLSQHHGGQAAMWWDMGRDAGRPVVYVARDSHANYVDRTVTFEDQANGQGERLADIEWRPLGPWARWPGRWGNSTGEGRSPQSPGLQHLSPTAFHSEAARA